jgi:hypothetical protein
LARRIVIDGGWGRLSSLDLYTAADQVLADDEELSSVDYAASDTVDQFALFTVIGNSIKGLPPDPAEQLIAAIRETMRTGFASAMNHALLSKRIDPHGRALPGHWASRKSDRRKRHSLDRET